MRQTDHKPTTRIVSLKSNLQFAYDCRAQQGKRRNIWNLKNLRQPLMHTIFAWGEQRALQITTYQGT